ncbi:MAG: hypothetical protein NC177_15280 [Ruminococcus flavefaciens]|nr:hypothetical protein [Ruminococcus flavefaciens]
MKKYSNFKLNYNFKDKKATQKALKAIKKFLKTQQKIEDMTVGEMITTVDYNLYEDFSRGDKCRIGRDISTLYNKGLLPELEKGKKKGVTNTYHKR